MCKSYVEKVIANFDSVTKKYNLKMAKNDDYEPSLGLPQF